MSQRLAIHIAIVVAWICSVTVALVADGSHGNVKRKMPPQLQARVQLAMQLTTSLSSENNIAKAHQACKLWNNVLCNKENDIPPNIRAICYGLQASCLTRVGLDDLAIEAFDASLNLERFLTREGLQDVLMGKGCALQRLMRYNEARQLFLKCSAVERAVCAAATCSLRLHDVDWALQVLKKYCQSTKADCSYQALGMLGTILYLEKGKNSFEADNALYQQVMPMLRNAATSSPLYAWIYHVLLNGDSVGSNRLEHIPNFDSRDCYLRLAEINQSPFDDPSLIQLDDKVLLHELLTNNTVDRERVGLFWPRGFVLPREATSLNDLVEENSSEGLSATAKTWILKQRAGYGSHGNQFVSSNEAMQYCSDAHQSEPCLCQHVIDPPLLICSRKFSLRVYVICLPGSDGINRDNVYISRKGLVKLASLPYSGDQDDDRVHMTNSGRENTMSQQDLVFLRNEIHNAERSYSDLWDGICSSVQIVMQRYMNVTSNQTPYQSELAKLGIPKIMGFDYMVDTELKPWLLEVNRFPGLEARDECDQAVKREVVRDAWVLAAKRRGIDVREMECYQMIM